MKQQKIRIAFIKFGGMTIGGSELWLQKIAVNLPKDIFEIDFYYCDDAPYLGGEHTLAITSEERINYLKNNEVKVIKFSVGAKNISTLTHDWVDTDFWEKFNEVNYDIIQTVKAGPKEYPFYKIKKPIVEIVALANRPDTSKNIAWSFHSSNWQRARWVRLGGSIQKSSVLTAPVEKPQSEENYREELGIGLNDTVAGFHQRNDNLIASNIPLRAFSELQKEYPETSKKWHFVIKNGGSFYRDQAKNLEIKNIYFLDQTPDTKSVSKFLNTLDIFAHGRKDGETFGAIFVEAMLHGKPCLSHYVENGANAQPETMGPAGVFAYSFEEYKNYLLQFFTDKTFRDNLAKKAKPHAEKYHSMEMCLEELTHIYTSVIGRKDLQEKETKRPVPYGYSDMGFLYAGDMNKPQNIAYTVLVGGIPEAFDVAIVKSLLPYTKTFFDIGANTGIYCWLAAQYYTQHKIQGKVYAFEPQTDCAEELRTTTSLNNWENIVTIKEIGLGSQASTMKLHLSGTGSTLTRDFTGMDSPIQSISVETLDSVTQHEKLSSVDFIKIDVEGFELEVLQGGKETILAHAPIIFIEIADKIKSRNYTNKKYTTTLSWLQKNGYRIWTCQNNTLKEITEDFHNESITMYLCLQKNKHEYLIPIVTQAVKDYRKTNLLFGILEKRILRKIRSRIIPPYITTEKILNYAKRLCKNKLFAW